METQASPSAADLYLDLIKKALTRLLYTSTGPSGGESQRWSRLLQHVVRRYGVPAYMQAVRVVPALHNVGVPLQRALRPLMHVNPAERAEGRDWPADAETMIGLVRLNNIQQCIEDVLRAGVPVI